MGTILTTYVHVTSARTFQCIVHDNQLTLITNHIHPGSQTNTPIKLSVNLGSRQNHGHNIV